MGNELMGMKLKDYINILDPYMDKTQTAYCTEVTAIDPMTGHLSCFGGPVVYAPSWEMAQKWCHDHMGFLKVIGIMESVLPTKEDGVTGDYDNEQFYNKGNLN